MDASEGTVHREAPGGRRRFAILSVAAVATATAALLVVSVLSASTRVQHVRARKGVETAAEAVHLVETSLGRLPRDNGEFRSQVASLTDRPDRILSDPWGHPYVYRLLGPRTFSVASMGADGLPGGDGWDGDIEVMRVGDSIR